VREDHEDANMGIVAYSEGLTRPAVNPLSVREMAGMRGAYETALPPSP
jgi:hypothetical protein